MRGAGPPDEAAIREALQAGMVHHDAGRLAEAETAYRKVLAAVPDRPDALVLLGAAAKDRGRFDEAIAAFRRAGERAPGFAPAWLNLALTLEELGRLDEAIAPCRRALEMADSPALRERFAHCAANASELPGDRGFRELVTRAMAEAWARPGDLAHAAIRLVRADPALQETIDAALAAWPARPAAHALLGAKALAALSRDRLLLALLGSAQVCEPGLERFLTLARHALVEIASDDALRAASSEGIPFFCALARQCFLNDYVFLATGDETARAEALRAALGAAVASDADAPELLLAAVGAHFPLASVPSIEKLGARSWKEPAASLIAQQVGEPRVERDLRAAIPRWTGIAAEVSGKVRQQYEESPYPRWVRLPAGAPAPLSAHLGRFFPRSILEPSVDDSAPEILVAGCGTGQEPADLALRIAGARVTAVDLSLASLAYAMRKTRELGLANVEYAQADILEMGSLGRTFDVISSVGVLHHLADPQAGWSTLASLLRPGGFMQVGLYSEKGRRDLAPARERIAARGYEPTPEGIRQCRRELLDSGEFPRLAGLRDLYGMNECRDLLFHVQEHRFTLPQVERMVRAVGLSFLGFVLEPGVRLAFRRRFPEEGSESSLERWDAFEAEFPDTFAGMYIFWLRKPARP